PSPQAARLATSASVMGGLMDGLSALFDRLAERGEVRGPEEVLRRARAQLDEPSGPEPVRTPHWHSLVAAALVVFLIVGVVLVVRSRGGRPVVSGRRPASSAEAFRLPRPGFLLWTDF